MLVIAWTTKGEGVMDAFTTCLWFDTKGEEAANYYAGIFPNSSVGNVTPYLDVERAGQTMTVGLKTDNAGNYFNVLPPGSRDVAVFVGSTDGNDWSGTLSADGKYTVRVYLMRSAARRNETARYTLTVGITGSPATPGAKP